MKKKKEKSRAYFKQNKESLSKAARERAQLRKTDSNTNQAMFEKDTEFGPKFICICCHGAYFEKDVYELTEKRRGQSSQKFLRIGVRKWMNSMN